MTSIIIWVFITIVHIVNARLLKKEPTNFWYKSSWFFTGWSTLATLYSIVEYINA